MNKVTVEGVAPYGEEPPEGEQSEERVGTTPRRARFSTEPKERIDFYSSLTFHLPMKVMNVLSLLLAVFFLAGCSSEETIAPANEPADERGGEESFSLPTIPRSFYTDNFCRPGPVSYPVNMIFERENIGPEEKTIKGKNSPLCHYKERDTGSEGRTMIQGWDAPLGLIEYKEIYIDNSLQKRKLVLIYSEKDESCEAEGFADVADPDLTINCERLDRSE